jgi:hypothetical protein
MLLGVREFKDSLAPSGLRFKAKNHVIARAIIVGKMQFRKGGGLIIRFRG